VANPQKNPNRKRLLAQKAIGENWWVRFPMPSGGVEWSPFPCLGLYVYTMQCSRVIYR